MAKGQLIAALVLYSVLCWLVPVTTFSQQIIKLQEGKNTSIRGLSVVSNSVAWVSGSNGCTARSTDGGTTWSWSQVAGYEKFDFRDIEAFSATDAIIVSAGTPAVILATSDAGRSWQEVYRNSSPDIFLDGMDFWSRKKGIIYGDPISGKMQLLQTEDGGKTWKDISQQLSIPLMSGEASFAASGTAIRTLKNGKVFIATGGAQSRLFFSPNYGSTWRVTDIPVIQGLSSTGPFSIAFKNRKKGIAVGGDYLRDTVRTKNLVLTEDGGVNWTASKIHPYGYRSAIEFITSHMVLTTGPTGTDISSDRGVTWRQLSSDGYNCVRKAKKGNLVLLAGTGGKISKLQF